MYGDVQMYGEHTDVWRDVQTYGGCINIKGCTNVWGI